MSNTETQHGQFAEIEASREMIKEKLAAMDFGGALDFMKADDELSKSVTKGVLDLLAFNMANLKDDRSTRAFAVIGDEERAALLDLEESLNTDKDATAYGIRETAKQVGATFVVMQFEAWALQVADESQAKALAGKSIANDDRRKSTLVTSVTIKSEGRREDVCIIVPINEKEERTLDLGNVSANAGAEGRFSDIL